MVIPGAIFYGVASLGGAMVIGLVVAIVAFVGFSALIIYLRHRRDGLKSLGATFGLAIRNLAIVTAVSGGAYFLFAAGYAWLAGAL